MDRSMAFSEHSTSAAITWHSSFKQWDVSPPIYRYKSTSHKTDVLDFQPQFMTTSSTQLPSQLDDQAHYVVDDSFRAAQDPRPSNHLLSFLPQSPEGPPLLSPLPIQPGPSFYHQLLPYSSSGFDMLKLLSKVTGRPNPRIMLGPVDMSCSFTVADARHPDNLILYASPSFCRLTGYSEPEIIGRNCRFLQSPDGAVHRGEPRVHTAPDAVRHFYLSLLQEKECQASLTNYRKDGSAFVNMVTVIPISEDDSEEITHFVGFQVDLSQHPNAILQKLRDGSYVVNYSIINPGPGGIRDRRGRGVSNELIQMIRGGNQEPVGRETERNEIHNLVLDNIEDFVHVLSLKGSLLYAAPSISRVLGYDSQELIGGSIADLCHPADVVPVMRELKDASSAPVYQMSHSSSRLGFPPQMTSPTPPPPPPTSLLFRALHKDGHYVWIISRGRLHVEPGKGRKAVVLVGRRVDSGILDAVVSRLLETRISQPEPFGENGWGLIATNGIILFANTVCSQRLGFSTIPTIAPSHALLTASASAHAYNQHQYMSPHPDLQMFPPQRLQHQSHQLPFQRPPAHFLSHIPATLVGRNIGSLIISPTDRSEVLQVLVNASSTVSGYGSDVKKFRCRIQGCCFQDDQQKEETIPVELRFYPATSTPNQSLPSIIFEIVFLPESRETKDIFPSTASILEYNSFSQEEKRNILPTSNAPQLYNHQPQSLTTSSPFKPQFENSRYELDLYPVQTDTSLLQTEQFPQAYSNSPKIIHSTTPSQGSTPVEQTSLQVIHTNNYDTPLFPLSSSSSSSSSIPHLESPPSANDGTQQSSCSRSPSQSAQAISLLSSLSTSPTSDTSWQYELTRLRFENDKMRADLTRLEKFRERSRRTKLNSFHITATTSPTSSAPTSSISNSSSKRQRSGDSASMNS